jgi:hypothetical protein
VFVKWKQTLQPSDPTSAERPEWRKAYPIEGSVMKRVVSIGLIAAAYALELPLMASQSSAAVIKVCELLPKDEVKKLIGGSQVFDMFPPQEEPLGTYGSSCNYPSVTLQVIPFLSSTIDAARTRGPLESVPNVGDEAYADRTVVSASIDGAKK